MTSPASWFARLGEPLSAAERAAIDAMFGTDALLAGATLETVADWERAGEFLRAADFDSAWWNHEEEERERLWQHALERHTEAQLAQQLHAINLAVVDDVRRAAHAAAARLEFSGEVEIAAATGAAMMAAHQAALADLAGEGATHCFAAKRALFAAGRWPLGYHRGRYAVF